MGEHPVVRSRSGYARRCLPNQHWYPPGCEAESHRQQYLDITPHEKAVDEQRRPQTSSMAQRASQGAWQWYIWLAPDEEAASASRHHENDSVWRW